MKYLLLLVLLFEVHANSTKGDIEFQKQNYNKAIEYYKKSTLKEDENLYIKLAQSYIRLGDNFKKTRNYKKALSLYKEAQKLNSRIAVIKIGETYELQADMYYRIKEYKKALELYGLARKNKNQKVQSKINKINKMNTHQTKLKNDTRKVVSNSSPLWTKSIGRLIIPTKLEIMKNNKYKTDYKKCSATLINIDRFNKTKVIVTASHCLTQYNKKAGKIRFIIKTKTNRMLQRTAQVYYDSHYDKKDLKNKSDYAILVLDKDIHKKDVEAMRVTKESFSKLQKKYKKTFASLAGFSSDVGEYGAILTYDPQCKIEYYNKVYAKSNCKGFKGASGGPVIMTMSDDEVNYQYSFIGVISHFRNGKFQEIFFAPHHIFYNKLILAIQTHNNTK